MSDMEINKVLSQMRTMAAELQPQAQTPPPAAGETNFADVMGNAVSSVSDAQSTANQLVTDFQSGATDASVAEVMVAMQKASLSFQAMTEVRNKLVEAYQQIMNMPI